LNVNDLCKPALTKLEASAVNAGARHQVAAQALKAGEHG
jgi:hypothetical protein